MQTFERIDPEGPCVWPEGHDLVDAMILSSPIPEYVVCTRCGRLGTVVVMESEDACESG